MKQSFQASDRQARIMFFTKAFHYNQKPIYEILFRQNHPIKILFLKEGRSWSRDKPPILEKISCEIVGSLQKKFDSGNWKRRFSVADLQKVKYSILEFQPDLFVARGRWFSTLQVMWQAAIRKLPILNRYQVPVWVEKTDYKTRMWDWLTQFFSPTLIRQITPILGNVETGIKRTGTEYLPFGADPSFLLNKLPSSRGCKPLSILSIGKFGLSRKRHEWIIRVLEDMQNIDFRLHLVGSIPNEPSEYYEFLKETINNSPIKDRIIRHEGIPYEKVQELLTEQDLFVLPSYNEPASVSVVEAMAHGLPVISSDDNGTSCYIEHGKNGFVFPAHDFEAFKDYIKRILTDPELLRSMSQRSLELVRKNHAPIPFYKRFRSICTESLDIPESYFSSDERLENYYTN